MKFRIVLMLFSFWWISLLHHGAMAQTDQDVRSRFPSFKGVKKVAQAGYQFLKINSDARGAAMGGAAITLEGKASSIFWNPAGLTSIEGHSVFLGFTQWFANMQHQAFAAATSLGKYGVLGLSAVNLDHGDIMGTAISNNNMGYEDTGLLNVAEMAFCLSYARRLTDKFGIGITAKYCQQNLDVRQSDIVAFDLGTIYNTGWNDVKISASIQHFSRELKYINEYYNLPLTYRVGTSVDLLQLLGRVGLDYKWIFAIEGVDPIDYSERVHIGTEILYHGILAFRSGYKFNYENEGMSLGVGLKLKLVEIDYAYSNFGSIGVINRFSALVDF